MNILELAPKRNNHGGSVHHPVYYSWHKLSQKGKPSSGSLQFAFAKEPLRKARIVKEDRVSIHLSDCMSFVIFAFSPNGDFILSGTSENRKYAKMSHEGVDALMQFFTEGQKIELPIEEVSAGKIVCKLPTK